MYDELIEGIPSDLHVLQSMVGPAVTFAKTEISCGVAMTINQRGGTELLNGPIVGMNLKDAAALAKSWNFVEASMGMAAINAWYNRIDHIREMGILPKEGEQRKNDVFEKLRPQLIGKNVAVVGHFPHLETKLEPFCHLTILERKAIPGDLPDSACEYIMEEQDFVIITGMTFTNKTLPRLLELTRADAVVSLTGPSVPMSEGLDKYGITHLSGYCVFDEEKVMEAASLDQHKPIFEYGFMLDYSFQHEGDA